MSKPRNTPSATGSESRQKAARQHCVKLGMKRDLRACSQAASADLVLLDAITSRLPTENAPELAEVLIGQRQAITRMLRLANRMLDKLEYVPSRVALVKGRP